MVLRSTGDKVTQEFGPTTGNLWGRPLPSRESVPQGEDVAVPITADANGARDDLVVDRLVASYEQFRPELVRRCRRIVHDGAVAEELAQEAFARALEHRERLDPERPLEAWLTTVATRLAVDWRRRKHPLVADDAKEPITGDRTFEAVSQRDSQQRIGRALAALPERHRRALVLFGVEGLSYSQIADAEGLSISAVKMTLHRARARMRTMVHTNDLFGAVPVGGGATNRGRRAMRSLVERATSGLHRAAEWQSRFEAAIGEVAAHAAIGAAVVTVGIVGVADRPPADPPNEAAVPVVAVHEVAASPVVAIREEPARGPEPPMPTRTDQSERDERKKIDATPKDPPAADPDRDARCGDPLGCEPPATPLDHRPRAVAEGPDPESAFAVRPPPGSEAVAVGPKPEPSSQATLGPRPGGPPTATSGAVGDAGSAGEINAYPTIAQPGMVTSVA